MESDKISGGFQGACVLEKIMFLSFNSRNALCSGVITITLTFCIHDGFPLAGSLLQNSHKRSDSVQVFQRLVNQTEDNFA